MPRIQAFAHPVRIPDLVSNIRLDRAVLELEQVGHHLERQAPEPQGPVARVPVWVVVDYGHRPCLCWRMWWMRMGERKWMCLLEHIRILDKFLLVPQDELWLVGHFDRVQGHGAEEGTQDRA